MKTNYDGEISYKIECEKDVYKLKSEWHEENKWLTLCIPKNTNTEHSSIAETFAEVISSYRKILNLEGEFYISFKDCPENKDIAIKIIKILEEKEQNEITKLEIKKNKHFYTVTEGNGDITNLFDFDELTTFLKNFLKKKSKEEKKVELKIFNIEKEEVEAISKALSL